MLSSEYGDVGGRGTEQRATRRVGAAWSLGIWEVPPPATERMTIYSGSTPVGSKTFTPDTHMHTHIDTDTQAYTDTHKKTTQTQTHKELTY